MLALYTNPKHINSLILAAPCPGYPTGPLDPFGSGKGADVPKRQPDIPQLTHGFCVVLHTLIRLINRVAKHQKLSQNNFMSTVLVYLVYLLRSLDPKMLKSREELLEGRGT